MTTRFFIGSLIVIGLIVGVPLAFYAKACGL